MSTTYAGVHSADEPDRPDPVARCIADEPRSPPRSDDDQLELTFVDARQVISALLGGRTDRVWVDVYGHGERPLAQMRGTIGGMSFDEREFIVDAAPEWTFRFADDEVKECWFDPEDTKVVLDCGGSRVEFGLMRRASRA